MTGVLGEAFRVVIKFAVETESELKNNDIEKMFGENADCRQKSFMIEDHHAGKMSSRRFWQMLPRSGRPVYESMNDERVKRVNDCS